MAFRSWKDITHCLIAGLNFTGAVGALQPALHAVKDEFWPAGSTMPTNIDIGIRNAELSTTVKFNSPTSDSLNALDGTGRVAMLLHEGNTLPANCWCYQTAMLTDLEPSLSADKATELGVTFTLSGKAVYATLVAPYAQRTTAGNTDSTYADMLATLTTGTAYLEVGAIVLGGASSATVTVRHSSDHITFNPHTAFTNVTALGAEYKALASTVQRYVSVSWAYNGGAGTSIDFAVAVASD